MCAFRLPRALTRTGDRGPSSNVAAGRVGGLGGRRGGRGIQGVVSRAARGGLEPLESRVLLSAYYVSPNGSNTAAGTASAPFKTLQHGSDVLKPGDTLIARAGTYAGFAVGWDSPQVGTASAPITYEADPAAAPGSVVINSKNAHTADGIDLEPGNSYVVLKGFTINNASGTITRSGIRVSGSDHVSVLDNVADGCGSFGIFSSFATDLLVQGNTATHTVGGSSTTGHGVYISNSAVRPVVRDNTIANNANQGLHLNGDVSQGGSGMITGALIELNVIRDNGANGINADGLADSRVQDNLIYHNGSNGIVLYTIDAAGGSKDNVITGNTIDQGAGGAALRIKDGATGNAAYDNVLLGGGGALRISADSRPGLVSDYNAVSDRFVSEDSGASQSLAAWRSSTGQDAHSFVATGSQLFVNASANDYHLSSTSPAVDAGTAMAAPRNPPAYDFEGNARPQGAAMDIGAYERGASGQPTDTMPPAVTGETPVNGATNTATSSSVTATFSESIQPSSLSFVLKDASGATVPAGVSYNDATRTATLTPSAALASGATYTATVTGARDLAGNPMAAPASWSFTTAAADTGPVTWNTWQQTTAADFGAGTANNVAVTSNSGGEVQLAPTLSDDFTGSSLGSGWTTRAWASGGTARTSGGVLSVSGEQVLSAASAGTAAVEGRVAFGAAAYQYFGLGTNFADPSYTGKYWAAFTTKGTTNTLYARVNNSGTTDSANLGAIPAGYHLYRVQPVTGGYQFYLDNALRATLKTSFPSGTALKAGLSSRYGSATPALSADWVRINSYPPSGTLTSSVFDAGRAATWGQATWNAALPTGTGIRVETSSGNTASPDGTWSAWAAVAGDGTIASPSARYIRYRVTFTTTNPAATAVLNDIALTWS